MCRESLYSTSKTGLLVFVDAKVNKLLDVLAFNEYKARRVFFFFLVWAQCQRWLSCLNKGVCVVFIIGYKIVTGRFSLS